MRQCLSVNSHTLKKLQFIHRLLGHRFSRKAFLLSQIAIILLTASSLASAQNVAYTLRNGLLVEGLGGTVSQITINMAFDQTDRSIVMLDNGLKRTFFSKRDIANKGDSTLSNLEIEIFQRVNDGNDNRGNGTLLAVGKFDEHGHRTITVRIPMKNGGTQVVPVVQGVTKISPLWTEVQTLIVDHKLINTERWDMRLATSSIPTDVLHNLLYSSIDPGDPIERLKIVDFYVEAQQHRRAIEEHAQIMRDFPDAIDNFQTQSLELQHAYGQSVLREARFRETVGQIELATQMAAAIDTSKMPPITREDFQLFLQETIKQVNEEIEQTREELVTRSRKYVANTQNNPEAANAAERLALEVESDLRRSNIERLASYKRLQVATDQTDEQLIALAITGWILGSDNAIGNMGVAESLFKVRDLVYEYLEPAKPGRRVQILQELENYEGGEPKYLAALINNIQPPEAPKLDDYTGSEPLEFEITIEGTAAQNHELQKFKYLVHLPPNYDPYRKYPCLMTLRAETSTNEQLERWAGLYNPRLGVRTGQAIRHGYVVVSLDWKRPKQTRYEYSAAEHKAILGCMRAMLKKFSIDSDRFFITGHGSGADAAYDVAISHPEHWAGVIGIAGKIFKYPIHYKENKHFGLNVYSVVGTKEHKNISESADAWNTWLKGGSFNKCLVVEYIGRLAEPFFEEFPSIMDWCDVTRRNWPSMDNCSIECKSLRPWDNYFWFMEIHGIREKYVMRPTNWPLNGRGFNPLKPKVKLSHTDQANLFQGVSPRGNKQASGVTFWLSPDFIDFKKRVEIDAAGGFRGFIEPSREVLLEDVRRRGDRKRPFWAKKRINFGGG